MVREGVWVKFQAVASQHYGLVVALLLHRRTSISYPEDA